MPGFDLQGEFGAVSTAIGNGTFDPQGINSTTFNIGTGSGDLQAGGSAIGNAASYAGISLPTNAPNSAITSASNVPAASATGTPTASTTTPPSASVVTSYVGRAAIIILGFIFVAVGLTMFGKGTSSPVQALKSLTPVKV